MNGRVMDPLIGRFLSADPFIPEIDNTQSWNRYSYVNNNPLSYVDPSGFFLKKLFRKLVKYIKWAIGVAVASAAYIGCGGPFNPGATACAVAATAAYGYVAKTPAYANIGFGSAPPTGPPAGRRDWASGVVRGSAVPDFGREGAGCFAANCNPGAAEYIDNLRRRGVILDACDSRGCWVTAEERGLAESGRYRDYYTLACKNGDLYACRAGEVATADGEGWVETLAVLGANARVQWSLLRNLGAITKAYVSICTSQAA